MAGCHQLQHKHPVLVTPDSGRRFLCTALTDWTNNLSETDCQSFLQARSMCYPTQTVLASYKPGTKTTCCLCQKSTETFSHVQTGCRELCDSYRCAHNLVVASILSGIQEHLPDLQISCKTELGSLSLTCPPDLELFKPYAFIINHKSKLLVIFEFTRGMADWNKSFETRMAKKRQAYHGVQQHLLSQFPDYDVCVSTFVLGVLGSILEQEWISQLANLELDNKACEKITQAAIKHGVKGCGQIPSAWNAKLTEYGKL
eukprot:3935818-Rhodomonas_salina.3